MRLPTSRNRDSAAPSTSMKEQIATHPPTATNHFAKASETVTMSSKHVWPMATSFRYSWITAAQQSTVQKP